MSARQRFRVLTRRRNGSAGAPVHDVQLQSIATGQLLWSQTFSDDQQARSFRQGIEHDLDDLDDAAFRRKHGVPSTA